MYFTICKSVILDSKVQQNEQKKAYPYNQASPTGGMRVGTCTTTTAASRKKKYSQKAITNDNTCTSSKVPQTESSQQVMPAQKVTALDHHTRTHVVQQQTSLAL